MKEMGFRVTPGMTQKETPGMTRKVTPGMTRKVTPGMTEVERGMTEEKHGTGRGVIPGAIEP